VALVAHDLAATEKTITDTLGVEMCFRDPGVGEFGLVNALFPIGDKLLEVVSPNQAGTTAGRLLDKRGGDSGYMVILEIDDANAMRARAEAAGARVVFEAKAPGVLGLHLHPADVGGAILSVDETDRWGEWPWAGPDWRSHKTEGVTDILAVEIEAADPAAMAARWAEVLGVETTSTTIALAEGEIRFVPAGARGDGVSALELKASPETAGTHKIAGCEFRLIP